jgi:hypothetical protein
MANKPLTWEEKLAKGLPLNELEQVKADASRITLRRLRDQKEEEELRAQKLAAIMPSVQVPVETAPAEVAQAPKDSK